MSVGHLHHVLIVYSLMEHVTWKYKTTKEEAAVLSKGLNFAVSPEAILTDEY